MIGSIVKTRKRRRVGTGNAGSPLSILGIESMLMQCLTNIPTYVAVGKDKTMVFTMIGETGITV